MQHFYEKTLRIQQARDAHILRTLELHEASGKPLDALLKDYFKSHKQMGKEDRQSVGETLYGLIRWKGLIDHLCPPPASAQSRLSCLRSLDLAACQKDPAIPEAIRYGVNSFLYNRLGPSLCHILNTQAPITLRVNTMKTTREELLKKLGGTPCKRSPIGIQFEKRQPFFSLPEFAEGLFEVQDEGSQLIADLIDAKPKQHVLDFCSGSGGKSLAIAPKMNRQGQLYLHDIRPHILTQARKRLHRAGIQNAQFLLPEHPKLKTLKGKVDWVLVDVPCSGTGTLRRNPELKWKIDQALVDRLVLEQRAIFAEALTYLKPDGKIVYATCSILLEENESQVEFFQKEHPLHLIQPPLSLLPEEGGPDGFFAAILTRKTKL